jgi:hypothetical protein
LLVGDDDCGSNTVQECEIRGIGPRLDVLLDVGSSWAFDLVEGQKGLRFFGALDEFFKAELATTFASQRVDVVDPMQQRLKPVRRNEPIPSFARANHASNLP